MANVFGLNLAMRYPKNAQEFHNLEEVIEEHLLPEFIPAEPIIGPGTKVATQGSCFAANLADALQAANISAECMELAEAINSPLANRIILEHAADPSKPYQNSRLAEFFPPESAKMLREKIATADVYVLTCGLAYSWFSRETGLPTVGVDTSNIHLYEHRLEGVLENATSIRAMVDALRSINSALKIVLTVSPVPMKLEFNGRSPFVGDQLSKSTLRLALEDYLSDAPDGVYYWPAYEIVRAVGLHLPPVFGADDGVTRHVNKDLVALIVRLFIKHFARAAD